MSGFLKNFDRIISTIHFQTNKHKFLVKFPLANFEPASLFFRPIHRGKKLSKDHSHDILELSTVASELTR